VLINHIHPDILGVRRRRCKLCPTKTASLIQRKRKNEKLKFAILKPKTDPKGGATETKKDDKRTSRRTGEADFMEGLN